MQTQPIPLCHQSSGLEIAVAVHDLRNRIGIAGCEVHLLRRRIAAEHQVASQYLASIERSLRAASDQLEAVLEFAEPHVRLEGAPRRPELDLVELVTRVVAQHHEASAAHELTILSTGSDITGSWDEGRLSLALATVLRNAIAYSPAGGAVAVTLLTEGDEAVVRVTDEGVGIPAADLPHIFRPFYRGRNGEAVCGGLGLGLATARLIVEQYGGALQADSIEGRGATFTLRLPLPTQRSGSDCGGPADPEYAPRARVPSPD